MEYRELQIPDNFLEPEIRCGYEVSTKLKKIWAVEMELLNELLRVCHKYDIKVFMFAGTLLGTVRHKGFIPWDDDVDVALFPEDYEKLVSVAEKEFKHPFFFQTAFTDPKYYFGYARLRNSNTTGFITYRSSPDYNNGIFIDIFVLNGLTYSNSQFKRQCYEMRLLEKILNVYNCDREPGVKGTIKTSLKFIARRLFDYKKLADLHYKVQSRYDSSSDRVSIVTHGKKFAPKYWCRKEDLSEIEYVPFENMSVPIPRYYDKLLTNTYGDYMKFPPASERGKWHEGFIIFDPDTPYAEFIRNNRGKQC